MNIRSVSQHERKGRFPALIVLSLSVVLAGNPVVHHKPVNAQHANATTAGPFVTLLFSQSEITASDNCAENDNGIARLDTVVAPYLQSLGMSGTGTLATSETQATTPKCTHYGDSLAA